MLWEGNLTWELPGECTDVRTLRDLPQNQEVFLATGKDSYIFDLLELLADEEEEDAAAIAHWSELAETNEADPIGEARVVRGVVHVVKGGAKRSVPVVVGMQGEVRVWLALIRLADKATDIVVTWNEVEWAERAEKESEDAFLRILASIEFNDLSFL